MSAIPCPSCNAPMFPSEIAHGWCASCGKKIPAFALKDVPKAGKPTSTEMRTRPAEPPKRLHKAGFVGVLVLMFVAGLFSSGGLLSDAPMSRPTTARAAAYYDTFGARGSAILTALVFLGVAIFCAYHNLKMTSPRAKGIAISLFAIAILGGLSVFAIPAFNTSRDVAWQRSIVQDLVPLRMSRGESDDRMPVLIRGKVLVWDATSFTPVPVKMDLPSQRQASQEDELFSVVLIVRKEDKDVGKYTSGEAAVRRDIVVNVFDWPEKKLVGNVKIQGSGPDWFVNRPKGENGPIIGDFTGALKSWINKQPLP